MNLFQLMLMCGITLASTAYADENIAASGSEQNNEAKTIKAVVNKESVSLYNFSEDLLKAAEECALYSEDFSQNNPEVKTVMSEMFGNTDFTVPVEILGKENDLCHFTVGYKLSGVGGSKYDCKINDSQRNELIEAMKDRSTELVTDTFVSAANDETDLPIETTITAGKFDVVLNKLQATACKLEEMLPSAEETEEAQKKFQQLPNEFIASLANCESMEISRQIVFFTEKTAIIGWNGDKCHVSYNGFDLNIPQAELSNILSYDELDKLCENPEIAIYDYKKNYNYDNLMFILQNCKNNIGSSKGAISSQTSGILETKNGIETLYKNNICELTFVNEVTIKEDKKDYSVVCDVPAELIAEVLEPYKIIMEKREEGQADNIDDITKIADGKIMYDLQIRNLCRLKNSQQ